LAFQLILDELSTVIGGDAVNPPYGNTTNTTNTSSAMLGNGTPPPSGPARGPPVVNYAWPVNLSITLAGALALTSTAITTFVTLRRRHEQETQYHLAGGRLGKSYEG
jgi:hypothetical protein